MASAIVDVKVEAATAVAIGILKPKAGPPLQNDYGGFIYAETSDFEYVM